MSKFLESILNDPLIITEIMGNEESKNSLLAEVAEIGLEESLVDKIVSAEDLTGWEFSNLENFQKVQEDVVNFYTDWNKESATLALSLYLEGKNTIKDKRKEDELVPLTFILGETLGKGWEDTNSEYTYKEFNKLSEDGKVWENIPLVSLNAIQRAAEKVTDESLEELNTKVNKLGVFIKKFEADGAAAHVCSYSPIFVDGKPIHTLSAESLLTPYHLVDEDKNITLDKEKLLSEGLDLYLETYPFLNRESLTKVLEAASSMYNTENVYDFKEKEIPVINLTADEFVTAFIKLDENENSRKLFSIARKLNLSKEEMKEAVNTYSWASTGVLKTLYDKLPESKEAMVQPVEPVVVLPEGQGDASKSVYKNAGEGDLIPSNSNESSKKEDMYDLFLSFNN